MIPRLDAQADSDIRDALVDALDAVKAAVGVDRLSSHGQPRVLCAADTQPLINSTYVQSFFKNISPAPIIISDMQKKTALTPNTKRRCAVVAVPLTIDSVLTKALRLNRILRLLRKYNFPVPVKEVDCRL
jgi:hypothetical protein